MRIALESFPITIRDSADCSPAPHAAPTPLEVAMVSPHEIKLHRLVLAVVLTVTIADLAPHPSLSPGLIESAVMRTQSQWQPESSPARTVAGR